jgi:VWFA-related protein
MRHGWLVLAPALLLLCGTAMRAQDPAPTFRTWIDLVTVDAWVHEGGRPIAGLTAADFEVRDNGVPQQVQTLGTTDSAHVIVGLDLSGSVDGETLERLRAGVRAVTAQLTSRDRLSLFTFGADVRLLLRAAVPGTLEEAALTRLEADGGTPLHDALVFGSALTHADARPAVLLLFTDGRDTASWTTAAQALDVLRRTAVVVYPIGAGLPAAIPNDVASEYFARGFWIAPTAGDTLRLLQSAATATGGEFLRIGPRSDLTRPLRQILARYRQRYLLTYTPTGTTTGGWHRLEVTLRSRRGVVVAREGYLGRTS